MKTLRQLIDLMESRIPDIEYEELEDRVIARVKSYKSQTYTKLAQKLERIEQLEAEVKLLKEEFKDSTREDVADIFAAEDAVKTRVVETLSFVLTLSKDPAPTSAPKYKDILEALSTQLTPELIIVLENLKKQMVTVTQKAPSLRIRPNELDEGLGSLFAAFKQKVFNWAGNYDQKLDALKQAV